MTRLKYLIIEDRLSKWEEYNECLLSTFPNQLEPHVFNKFTPYFEENEDQVYASLSEGHLDLLIADISLAADTKDVSKYSTQLLLNVYRRLEAAQNPILRRKGLGIILVTQFPHQTLKTIIQDNLSILKKFWWSFTTYEDFESQIGIKIQEFLQEFTPTNWGYYHEEFIEQYIHDTAVHLFRFPFFDQVGNLQVRGADIIALKMLDIPNRTALLHYTHQNQLKETKIQFEENQYNKLAVFTVPNGRQIKGVQLFVHTTYFLQISSTPLVIINACHPVGWGYSIRSNRGRILHMQVANSQLSFECPWPTLNRFFDQSENFVRWRNTPNT